MKRTFILFLVAFLAFSCTGEREYSDWRGPNRDGIFPESGLLKQWPADGPALLWSCEDLGFGHTGVAVAGDKIYVTGIRDSAQSVGTLFVFNTRGDLLLDKEYGQDFTINFIGTRSTSVVVDDLIYIESGAGAVYCLQSESGEEVWSRDFVHDFGADSAIQFGYSESVLIDGDRLICVPGGKEQNVVALDRFNGELVWSSTGFGEQADVDRLVIG